MKETPSFEFVIPAYGPAPFLEETLSTLRGQAMPVPAALRWVRRPAERLFEAPADLRVVETAEARGIGGDWEAALELSHSDWTCIAHSDDRYSPGYSAEILAAARRFPEAGVIFTDCDYQHGGLSHGLLNWIKRRINPATRWRLPGRNRRPVLIRASTMARALRWGAFVPCPTLSYQTGRIRAALGGRPLFSRSLKTALDWLACIELARAGVDFVYIPKPLVSLRVHADATTQDTLRSGERAREETQVLLLSWGPRMAALLRRAFKLGQWLQRISDDRSP